MKIFPKTKREIGSLAVALFLAVGISGYYSEAPQARNFTADIATTELNILDNVKPELTEKTIDAENLIQKDADTLTTNSDKFESEIPKTETQDIASLTLGTSDREELRYFNHNAQNVEGEYSDNKIIYKDIWSYTDLLVTMLENGVKEDIILKNSQAPTTFEYLVETVGLRLELTPDGGFEFLDRLGDKKFYTPAPDLTDATGKKITAGIYYKLEWETVGSEVVVEEAVEETSIVDSPQLAVGSEAETVDSLQSAVGGEPEDSTEEVSTENSETETSTASVRRVVEGTLADGSEVETVDSSQSSDAVVEEIVVEEALETVSSVAEETLTIETSEAQETETILIVEDVGSPVVRATTSETQTPETSVETPTVETPTNDSEATADESETDTSTVESSDTEISEPPVEETPAEPVPEETSSEPEVVEEVEETESVSFFTKLLPKFFRASLLDSSTARESFENSEQNYEQIRQDDGSILRRYKLALVISSTENLTFPLDLDPSTFVQTVDEAAEQAAEEVADPTAAITTIGRNLTTNNLTVRGTLTTSGTNLSIDSGLLYLDSVNDRVGIGTTAPTQKLEVTGTIYSTTGGFKLPDGTVIDASGDLGKWGGSTDIYYSGGNVGIGTTSPESLIHISGTTPKFYLTDLAGGADSKHWFMQSFNGVFNIGSTVDSFAEIPGTLSWTETQPAGAVNKFWHAVSSDSDGTNLIAGAKEDRLYTSSDSGVTWTERQPAGDVDKNWNAVASDSDGLHLVAGVFSGRLYTSSDSGSTWIERQPAGDIDKGWNTVSSDSDGTNLIAAAWNGRLYTSSDSGSTWIERQPAGDINKPWNTVFSDLDGTNLIAAVREGRLYTSSDSGATWTERQPAGNVDKDWQAVSSNSTGSNLIVGASGGRLYTSSDSGATWTERQPAGDIDKDWWSVVSDSDGSTLVAGVYNGRLYTSSDSGVTWTETQPAGNINKDWYSISSDSDGTNIIAAAYGGHFWPYGDRLYTAISGAATPADSTHLTINKTSGNVGIGTTVPAAVLEVDGGIAFKKVTADPCGDGYPEGVQFYNDTADCFCFCDGAGVDKKVSDNTACF